MLLQSLGVIETACYAFVKSASLRYNWGLRRFQPAKRLQMGSWNGLKEL